MTESVGKIGKSATFHMTACTESICTKKIRIFGTKAEVKTDGWLIRVRDFVSGKTRKVRPPMSTGGHSRGDFGLMRQFILAIDVVKNDQVGLKRAQIEFIGCTAAD
jgi:hypothetical protein